MTNNPTGLSLTQLMPFVDSIQVLDTTDSSSISTGSIINAGGIGCAKNITIGGTVSSTLGITAGTPIAVDSSGFSGHLAGITPSTMATVLSRVDLMTFHYLGAKVHTIGTGCQYATISSAITGNPSYTIENVFLVCNNITDSPTIANNIRIQGISKEVIVTGTITIDASSKFLSLNNLTVSSSASHAVSVIGTSGAEISDCRLYTSGANSGCVYFYRGNINNTVTNCELINSHNIGNGSYLIHMDLSTSGMTVPYGKINITNNIMERHVTANIATNCVFFYIGNDGNTNKIINIANNSIEYRSVSTNVASDVRVIEFASATNDYINMNVQNNEIHIIPGTLQTTNSLKILSNYDTNSTTNCISFMNNNIRAENYNVLDLIHTTTGSRDTRIYYTGNNIISAIATINTGLANFDTYVFDNYINFERYLYSHSNVINTSGLKIEDAGTLELEAVTEIVLDSATLDIDMSGNIEMDSVDNTITTSDDFIVNCSSEIDLNATTSLTIDTPSELHLQLPVDSAPVCNSTVRFDTTGKAIYYIAD